jgi:hypothetical protein
MLQYRRGLYVFKIMKDSSTLRLLQSFLAFDPRVFASSDAISRIFRNQITFLSIWKQEERDSFYMLDHNSSSSSLCFCRIPLSLKKNMGQNTH